MLKELKGKSQLPDAKPFSTPYPRRGFLQRCALVTGAFVMGVFRIDNAFGWENPCITGESNNQEPPYCCHLSHDPDCDITDEESCKSKFYWVCPWCDEDENVPYFIRCVECFKIHIPKHGNLETNQCHREISDNKDSHTCGKAVHPDDPDYLEL